jgi:hypothetical protein
MPTPFPTQFTTRTPVSTDNHDIRIAKGEARQLDLETDFALLLGGIPGIADLTTFVNVTVAASNLYVTLASGPYLTTADAATTYIPATSILFDGDGNITFAAFDFGNPGKVGMVLPKRDASGNNIAEAPVDGCLLWDTGSRSVKVSLARPLETPNYVKVVTASDYDLNTQTGTGYNVIQDDNGRVITLNNANPITVTIDAGVTSVMQGFWCKLIQLGVGQVTVTSALGLGGNNKISGRYGAAYIHIGRSSEILMSGDLTA